MGAFGVHFRCGPEGVQRVSLTPTQSADIRWSVEGASQALTASIDSWMQSYIAGDQVDAFQELDWQQMPPFTRQVLQRLQTLPAGQVVTYKELAALAGRPKAARAVGQACARNPFPLLIPCHRVLGSQGLTGFAFGVDLKQQMLAMEGWHASSI